MRILLVGMVTACAPASPAPSAPEAPSAAPVPVPAARETTSDEAVPLDLSAALVGLEEQLLEIDFALRFEIEADGGAAARFVGELRSQGDRLSLRARGVFAGEPVELTLDADRERLRGSNGDAKLDLPRPVGLEEAIVIGLTRMGLLHNLAVLTRMRPPDGIDGAVREWVCAQEVVAGASVGPESLVDPALHGQVEAMSFQVVVADHHAGDATLWWDPASKLPVERHQVVRFPDGEMTVRERYAAEWLRRPS